MTDKVEIHHQTKSLIPAFIGYALFTLNIGWLAPVLKHSERPQYDIFLTSEQRSLMASIHDPFKVIGMICSVVTIDKVGRKPMLFVASLCHLVGWALIRLSKSITVIYVARGFFGFMFGILDVTTTICIGENTSPDIRGTFTGYIVMAFFGGLVIEFALATYLPYDIVATVNFVAGVLHFLSIFLMKETVQYLIMKKRYEEAERNFQWFFAQNYSKFREMKERIRRSAEMSLSLNEFFKTPAFHQSVKIGVVVTMLLYATGFWALLSYSSIAFTATDFLTPNEFTILYSLIQFFSTFGSSYLIDHFNRRTILLSALILGTLTNGVSAILYYVQQNITPVPSFPWLVFASITSFMIISAMITLPVSIVLRSELFPQKVKPLGVGLSSLSGSIGIFLSSFRFIQIAEAFGIYVDFLMFALLCMMSFIFIYLFLPETRGKSSFEIEQEFNKGEQDGTCYV